MAGRRHTNAVIGACVLVVLAACDGVELPDLLSKDRTAEPTVTREPSVLPPVDKVMKGKKGQSYLSLGVHESVVIDGHQVELVAVKRQKGKLTAMIHVVSDGQPKVQHRLHSGDQFLLGERAATVVLVTPTKFSAELKGEG